ncbi:MAG TPA: pilus assembly protein HicB [Nocardioidaceae bacterium]|jgi:hypothetical protein|nr:pilus assembly protein HicB [Actinomycetota bacterium]MDQ3423897.1 pilus assembly protein HicB [Actinomycetota bacterium]HEV8056595.1 pilus assembly protein HicB [Nocardioidaceae bacterium]
MVVRMDTTPYLEDLRADLISTASVGGDDVAAAAERLVLALQPALRMVLLEALSDAAAEISQQLEGGSVEVRLKGREPQFVVTAPPPPTPETPAEPEGDEEYDEDGPVARITLRLPDALKQRAEELAGRRGQSLNTWLVAAVRAATRERAINVDIDLSSVPFGSAPGRNRRGPGQHVTGWAR